MAKEPLRALSIPNANSQVKCKKIVAQKRRKVSQRNYWTIYFNVWLSFPFKSLIV